MRISFTLDDCFRRNPVVAAHPDDGPFIIPLRTLLIAAAVSRYRKLARNGKQANVVTAAIARELAGFVWAIARRVPPAAG
jgi:hypothetical protein